MLINGDSILELKKINSNSIDAIISDIPYGISQNDWDILHNNKNSALGGTCEAQKQIGKVFKRRGKPLNGWSEADKNISKQYQEWCSSWSDETYRILKPGASCLLFSGRRYAHRCICAFEDSGFTFKDILAWIKPNAILRAQRISEVYNRRGDVCNSQKWEGWRVANLRPVFEPILWFQKTYKIGSTLADNIIEHNVGAWDSNVIQNNLLEFGYEKSDRGLHETQKPLKLIETLVSLVTIENQIVLDPFMGSATTGVACKNLNRRFIGIEKDEGYFNIAKNRIGGLD